MTYLRRDTVKGACQYLGGRFGTIIKESQEQALWDELDAQHITEEHLLFACKKIVQEEDSLPRNLTKAILARRPITRDPEFNPVQIDPDTGAPYHFEETVRNRNRVKAGFWLMGLGAGNDLRDRLVILEGCVLHLDRKLDWKDPHNQERYKPFFAQMGEISKALTRAQMLEEIEGILDKATEQMKVE